MSRSVSDIDQPTVARRLSPRARAASTDSADPVIRDLETLEEPTIALVNTTASEPLSDARGNAAASLQITVDFIRQLEVTPERSLVRAAAPLLLIVAQLRNSIDRADVAALRRQIVEAVDSFEQCAHQDGTEAGDIVAARYVLCATVDETVLMTPWGSRSEWSANSLLNQFHNETWGGEKVFAILSGVQARGANKTSLLLLIHTCLLLGFEGRFRVIEGGRSQLEDLRSELWRTIRQATSTKSDEPLSKSATGERGGRRLNSFLPLWMLAAVGLGVLGFVYMYASYELAELVNPLVARIETLVRQ